MIHRIKRPKFPKVKEPKVTAYRDYVLHRRNFNPYRPRTPEHHEYERAYRQAVDELPTAATLNDPRDKTADPLCKEHPL